MVTERRPAKPTTRVGAKPETRIGTKPGTQRSSKPDSRVAKQPTARTARGVPSSKKNNLPLILGGAGGGLVVLILIIAVAASGGSKAEDKKEEKSTKSSGSSGPTGPKVDENLLKQGMHKCNQGLAKFQSLKSRIDQRKSMSDAERAALRKDIEDAKHQLMDGMKDIETSNGKENVSQYGMAIKEASSALKELSAQ